MGNCFRVRGVVADPLGDLAQFEATGTLFDVLVSMIYYTNEFRDQIQILTIEQMVPERICVENAVFDDVSKLVQSGISMDELAEKQSELEQKYDALFTDEYKQPRVNIESENGKIKRIVIEAPEDR